MNLDHEKVANGVLSRSRYINSEAAQIHNQYIDKGDYSSIIIMQDDGIHANLRYTQQAYVATVMLVTHAIFLIVNVLFLNNHIFCIPRNYM